MQHEELCREVERQLQFKPKVRTDFDYLSEKILAKTHETVSSNTLMRLWGYRESVNARRSTLDILARFLGYADYVTFCNWPPSNSDEPQSDEVMSTHLRTADLTIGQQVELTWLPDRRCVVQLCSDGSFEVKEAENTKLSVGDTFKCDIFIEGEPLYLSNLVHECRSPMVYVAGKKDGVRFNLIP